MDYMNQIISRIESDKPIVLDFDIDEFTRRGSGANVIGLTRFKSKWYVEIEPHEWLGTSETINLVQYMENTKDIK